MSSQNCDITVNSNGTVSPDPYDVGSSPNVSIKWCAGSGVVGFTITGLNSSEFNPTSSNSCVTSFTTTDVNNDSNDYSYTVEICDDAGNVLYRFDPTIKNGGN